MPLLHVNLNTKKTAEEKRFFMDKCAEIISTESGCSIDAINVYIHEHDPENVKVLEKTVIYLNWMEVPEKRTNEVKNNISFKITEEYFKLTGMNKEKIIIMINDYPPHNLSVGGKTR